VMKAIIDLLDSLFQAVDLLVAPVRGHGFT
jgi:hypothetical protein